MSLSWTLLCARGKQRAAFCNQSIKVYVAPACFFSLITFPTKPDLDYAPRGKFGRRPKIPPVGLSLSRSRPPPSGCGCQNLVPLVNIKIGDKWMFIFPQWDCHRLCQHGQVSAAALQRVRATAGPRPRSRPPGPRRFHPRSFGGARRGHRPLGLAMSLASTLSGSTAVRGQGETNPARQGHHTSWLN